MIEAVLNRWRGTGDIFKIFGFAITGNSKGWENQELVYGLFQGLFFNYVIITNII